MSHRSIAPLPSVRCNDYNHQEFLNYLAPIHAQNRDSGFGVCEYTHGLGADTPIADAYTGGIYSPTSNRIYLMPRTQCAVAKWHYIDCGTGSVVAYTHGLGTSLVAYAYVGGVYDPVNDRIFLVPYQTAASQWHYIDCKTGVVVPYTHGTSISLSAYAGGCYSPSTNRIYFSSFRQPGEAWHYIACTSTPTVGTSTNNSGVAAVNGAYYGAVYSATQDRIYYIPIAQTLSASWHYLDCTSGNVVAYVHGTGISDPQMMFVGGVYSPMQDRIYLSMYANEAKTETDLWYYIDCNDGTVVSFVGGVATAALTAYSGVYSPSSNRIYWAPAGQGGQSTWVHLDCNTTSNVAYTAPACLPNGYLGACYSPTNNRIYFAPGSQSNQSTWHYIQEYTSATVAPAVAAYPMFNKL